MMRSVSTRCPICSLPILEEPDSAALLFLCRHVVHLRCVRGGENVEYYSDPGKNRGVSGRIALCVFFNFYYPIPCLVLICIILSIVQCVDDPWTNTA